MMKEGISATLEYTWDGIAMYAQLRNTDYSSVGIVTNTVDPNWYVWQRDNDASMESEWLNYVTNDGRTFQARCHCELEIPSLVPGTIRPWFEHRQIPGGAEFDSGIIRFLDWDKQPWEALLKRIKGPFPKQPTFTLKRL